MFHQELRDDSKHFYDHSIFGHVQCIVCRDSMNVGMDYRLF